MPGDFGTKLVTVLDTLNQILAAGISITAFSLLLYALTFNLRDRVARSFTMILLCVAVVFTGKSIGSAAQPTNQEGIWQLLQWVGIIFLPPAYLHFSDALLTTTGRPSRGRRIWAVRLTYLFSFLLAGTLPINPLFSPINRENFLSPLLSRPLWLIAFSFYYGMIIVLAWINFARALRRTRTSTTRRRLIYLLAGSTAPAIGSYPYFFIGSGVAAEHPVIFLSLATINNILVGGLLIVMAYAVAFFGVVWPDRVVKSRLFKWIMRGPVTACVVLAITTLVRRTGLIFGVTYSAFVPVVMVFALLLMEFTITLFSPLWEKVLFYGKDRNDLTLLRDLEDRLLTRNDLRQFLEMVVSAVCDRLQAQTAFIAALNGDGLELVVKTGDARFLSEEEMSRQILPIVIHNGDRLDYFRWGNYFLFSLRDGEQEEEPPLLGLLGVVHPDQEGLDDEQLGSLTLLAQRAALALRDRHIQQDVFRSLQTLNPQVDLFQRLRAAARYNEAGMLMSENSLPSEDVITWVKEALTHYWGGPKLTDSPLLRLKIVQDTLNAHEGNAANALRAILRKAIEQVRPEGERRFTGEWILYNILELKFLEGRKVREVALRLAMSEADLYRKQRVAIEAVAKAIIEMEEQAHRDMVKIPE